MNWDQIHGNWLQTSGKVREKWGKLTGDDVARIAGKRDQVAGLVQQRYGDIRSLAEKNLAKAARSLKQ